MPHREDAYSHPDRSVPPGGAAAGVHSRSGSLTNLARLPGVARAKLHSSLAHNPFVRFLEDNDGQDKDENDIYRQNPADQVFTFERWNKHRNSFRYAKHLAHMFSSRVFRQLLGPVLAVMALALFVGVYETLVNRGGLPGHWPHVTLALGQGFNLTAFALSLLLVFRTNSSYDRWWEARKLWGGTVNRSRDIVRQSLVFFREEDVHLKELLARWAMAFPFVLMCHLRESADVQKEVTHILTAQEVSTLMAAAHRPNFVLQVMAETIRAARPHELARMRMDDNLTFFEDAMGSMERILRTPIPLSYTRHTSRFLLVWLILLPFTLWAAYSWFSVLLSGIFAFLMFGIDEIGVQIEEPFGILPLESISQTIERNIRELLARNFEVAGLVRQATLLPASAAAAASASSSAADLAALPGGDGAAAAATAVATASRTGNGAAAVIAAVDEFGEMTGATAVGGEGAAAGKSGGAPVANLISLTASAGEAGAAAPPRRVQFGGATVIEMGDGRGSMDGAREGHGAGSPLASPRTLNRMASLVEVELAQGASPLISPRNGGAGSSYSDWLHD
ncbi:hypothetical protein ABPG75_011812 [Micractinium tetrahymenae]